jgi:hypothetical protein
MDGDFSTEALKAKQRKDLPLRAHRARGREDERAPARSPVAHDVVFELVDDQFLLGDDVFHQVAAGDSQAPATSNSGRGTSELAMDVPACPMKYLGSHYDRRGGAPI